MMKRTKHSQTHPTQKLVRTRVDGHVGLGAAVASADVLVVARLPVPEHAALVGLGGQGQAAGRRGGLGTVPGHVLLLQLSEHLLQLLHAASQHLAAKR